MPYQELKFYKVTELPLVPESSSVYFVKKDPGNELVIHMTDINGVAYYKTRDQADILTTINNLLNSHPYLMLRNPNPIYTYGTGQNSKSAIRIDYSNGVYRTFEYNSNNSVKKITHFGQYFTIVKDYVYNVNGTVNRINETVT